jgi:hypothetical protein
MRVAWLLVLTLACSGEARPPLPPGPVGPAPCPLDAMDGSGACWERVAPFGSGAFPAAWQPGKFPMGITPVVAFGSLWMVGEAGAWSSGDGLTWTPHPKARWGDRIGEAVVFFRGQLWMFGGLDYQSRAFLRDIWRSSDGEHWERAGEAAWPARMSHTVVAFHDRLWLFGGGVHIAADRSPDGFVNDVWSSEDGLLWTQVTAAAPWPAMDYPQVQVFQDALYLLGGQGQGEVWRSPDGAQWARLERQDGWVARFDHGTAVFDGRLWVYGGEPAPRAPRQHGVPIPALNDVWHSTDGLTWRRQAEHGPFSPRMTRTSVVFRDRLWLFSGKRTGSPDSWGGDVWTMKVSAGGATPAAGP